MFFFVLQIAKLKQWNKYTLEMISNSVWLSVILRENYTNEAFVILELIFSIDWLKGFDIKQTIQGKM